MNDQFSAPRGSLTRGRLEFPRGAAGGRLRLESRDAGGANGRYEIEISGGASHVQVITEGASA
jgi:hypothetical protein